MKLHLPKRLLTALLAAFTAFSLSTGSTAWGYSTIKEDTAGNDLLFSYSNGSEGGSATTSNNFTPSADGAGIANSANTQAAASGLTACSETAPGFTVSVDVVDFKGGDWRNFLTLYTNNASAEALGSLQLQKNTSNQIMVYAQSLGGSAAISDNLNLGSVDSWKGQTLTLSFASTGTEGVYTLTVYKNGESVGSLTYSGVTAPGLTGYCFGDTSTNSRSSDYAVYDNVAIWSKSMSAAEVKNLVIPSYVATLNAGKTEASAVTWTGKGESWQAVTQDTSAYLRLAGDANGSTLDVGGDFAVQRIDATANAVTIESTGTVTVNELWASSGAALKMNSVVSSTTPLTVGGAGSVTLLKGGSVNGLALYSTLNLAPSTTLSVNGAASLQTSGKISGGELEILNGATFTVHVANLSGQSIASDIRIASGGRMEMLGSSSDTFKYGESHTVYLEGTAELALEDTRQTVGNWTFDMKGGTISGKGVSGNLYALDFHTTGYIKAHAADDATAENPTVSTVSASVKTRDNGLLNLVVDEKARLNLTGNLQLGKDAIKSGAGQAVIAGSTTVAGGGSLTVSGGSLTSTGAFTNNGSVTVDSGTSLELSGGYTQNAGASLTINGLLTLGGSVVLYDSITANGEVILKSDVVFNLTNLTKGENNLYTLFTGSESVSYTNVSFIGKDGWSYTMQTNGTVLATFLGNTVTWAGDSNDTTVFEWTTGTTFSEDKTFNDCDNVNITGSDKIKLTSAVTANKVTIGAADGADMTVSFTSDSNILKVTEGFIIQDGATVELNKETKSTGFIQGEVTIESGGVLKFNAKDVTGYNGGATSMHTINVQAGGELQLNINSNETFAGTLNLDGTLKGVHSSGSARWDLYGGSATINVSAGATASTENIKLYLRQNNTVITVGDKATFEHAGTIEQQGSYTLAKKGSGSMIVGGLVNITTLNVDEGTMDLQADATITNVSIANGATLTLGKKDVENAITYGITNLTGAGGGVLNLKSNAILNKITSVSNRITVSGSGTYVMGNSVTSNLTGWTDSANWTGTVELNGMNVAGNAASSVHNFGNSKSTIKLSGVSGWINSGALDANLLLKNDTNGYALKIVNGTSNGDYNFRGEISGSGDLEYQLAGSNSQKFYFTKDISGWTTDEETGETPEIRVASNHTLSVYLQESASTVNVSFVKDNGVLNLDVSTSAAATFSESVTVTGLSLHQSATFNDTLTASTISVDANKVLELAGTENYTLAAVISGGGSLTKSGENTITLSAANTYTGATRVEGGELVVTKSNADSSSSYYIAEGAKLKVDAFSGEWNKTITGDGTLSLVIGTNSSESHGNFLQGISGFNGVLEISKAADSKGNVNLSKYILGTEATFKLISGNHWGSDPISRDVELAGTEENHFAFRHDGSLELSGKVTGTYLTSGRNYGSYGVSNADNTLSLSGQGSNIQHVIMEGGTLTVNADMFFGTITANNVVIGNETVLTLGGGKEDSPVAHSIGKLSATSAGVVLGNYATLSLGGGTAEVPVTHSIGTLNAGTGSKLNLAENAVLNTITSVTGSIAITGKGLYELATSAKTLTENVSLDSNWTGTVAVQGVTSGGNDKNPIATLLENLSNGTQSKVQLSNVQGWLSGASTNRHILLKNTDTSAALTLNDGSTYGGGVKTSEFAGSIGGSGDIVFDWSTDSSNTTQRHLFSGDTSTWSGKFINQDCNTMTMMVEFSKSGNVFNSTVDGGGILNKNAQTTNSNKSGGKMLVKFNSSDTIDFYGTIGKEQGASGVDVEIAQNSVNFHKTIDVDSIAIANNASATVISTLSTNSVQLGNTATITKAEGKEAASMQNVKLSEEGIASADETKATKGSVTDAKVTLAALAEGTSFSIEDVTLTNVNIEAENADDRVNLSGLSTSDVQLAKGEFHMLDQAQVQVGTGGTAVNLPEGGPVNLNFTTSLMEGMTLGTDASLVVDLGNLSGFDGMSSGKPTFSITLAGFSIEGFNIGDFLSENPGIYFAADSWLGQLLVAQGASDYVKSDSLEAGAQATAGSGSGVSVSYNSTAVGTVIIISGLQVPEPTTTSLSLLALSALAMRRRRK